MTKFLIAVVVVGIACGVFGLGAVSGKYAIESQFKSATNVELHEIYEAKRRCEAQAGEGNCKMIGAFIPRNWQPAPKPEVKMEVTPQRSL